MLLPSCYDFCGRGLTAGNDSDNNIRKLGNRISRNSPPRHLINISEEKKKGDERIGLQISGNRRQCERRGARKVGRSFDREARLRAADTVEFPLNVNDRSRDDARSRRATKRSISFDGDAFRETHSNEARRCPHVLRTFGRFGPVQVGTSSRIFAYFESLFLLYLSKVHPLAYANGLKSTHTHAATISMRLKYLTYLFTRARARNCSGTS